MFSKLDLPLHIVKLKLSRYTGAMTNRKDDQKDLLKARAIPVLGATAAYLGLALAMTYPLVRYFGSFAAAGSEDGAMSMWSLWWIKSSLLDLGQNPLNCQYLFYPDGINLVFTTSPKALALFSIGSPVL